MFRPDTTRPIPAEKISDETFPMRIHAVIALASSHFALLSAMFFVVGVASSLAFLICYLWVFDWRLFWMIEYQDLIKIGMIFIGIFFGYISISYIVVSLFTMPVSKIMEKIKIIVFLFLVLSALFYFMYDFDGNRERRLEEFFSANYLDKLSGAGYIIITSAIILLSFKIIRERSESNFRIVNYFIMVIVLFIMLSGVIGARFAHIVRDTAGFRSTIVLDDNSFTDAGIIMNTTHHLFLHLSDGSILVVPGDRLRETRSPQPSK